MIVPHSLIQIVSLPLQFREYLAAALYYDNGFVYDSTNDELDRKSVV